MFGWCAETVVVTTGLAGLVVLAGRWFRLASEARHALWVVVLLKFLLPPVIAWPWAAAPPLGSPPSSPLPPAPVIAAGSPAPAPIAPARPVDEVGPPLPSPSAIPPENLALAPVDQPEPPAALVLHPSLPEPGSERKPASEPTTSPAPVPIDPEPVAIRPAPISVPPIGPLRGDPPRWTWLLLACWLGGVVVVGIRGLVRVARFGLSLRGAEPAPGWLVDEVARVGVGLGVRRVPSAVVLADAPGPLLWCLGPPRLVLPAGLDRMPPEARAGLLAHELAHLVRGDPWVVWLDLAAGLVWWWNPVCRFARRRLRAEAEAACDALVLRAFPENRFAYAEALVLVCEAHVRPSVPLPALGMGAASAARTLEARLLMILHDPIRPPSRWLPPAALALLAMILPTWTLGQQPTAPPTDLPTVEVPSSRPADPSPLTLFSTNQPVMAPGFNPPPVPLKAESWTIERIRQEGLRRPWPEQYLTFRYTVASRLAGPGDRTRVNVQAGDVVVNRPSENNPNIPPAPPAPHVPVPAMPGQLAPVAPNPEPTQVRFSDEHLGRLLKFDILQARPGGPGDVARELGTGWTAWDRRFAARAGSDIVSFETNSVSSGPIPVRWLPADPNSDPNLADDLTLRLYHRMIRPRPSPEPFEPGPEYLLDLAGPASVILNGAAVQLELAGTESINGVEAVRVAWLVTGPNDRSGTHGHCWVAPGLGFAVVRFEAAAALPRGEGPGRQTWQTWRKDATGFRPVGDRWLPGQVTYKAVTTRMPPQRREPNTVETVELTASFEDYQFHPTLDDAALKPQLILGARDAATGTATAVSPALPPGLADRLQRAVAASPFGPPHIEVGDVQPASPPATRSSLAGSDEAPKSPPLVANLFEGASPPAAQPSVPTPFRAELDQPRPNDAKARPDDLDPKLVTLQNAVQQAQRLSKAQSAARNPGDPAVVRLEKALSQSIAELTNSLKGNTPATLDPVAVAQPRDRGAIANRPRVPVLQARRDAQAAEVRIAEAERERAQADARRADVYLRRNAISAEEFDRIQMTFKVAVAKVAREQAKLAEADALLNQEKSPRVSEPSEPTSDGKPPALLSDYRDQVELAELQLEVKQVEMQRAEAKAERAKQLLDLRTPLAQEGRITQKVIMDSQNDLAEAQDEVKTKRIEVREAELRLKQSRRRAEAEEVRLKRLAERAKDRLDWSRKMFQKGYVSAATFRQDRDQYDDLMFQLNPNYKPEPESPENPAPTSPAANSP